MNVFDYFFDETKHLKKDFILNKNESISFKKLYENSLKIASFLKENIGENKNIMLLSKNSLFFITAYLGILKSGNCCIPINYEIEQNNLDFIIQNTKSNIIFISKKFQSNYLKNNFGYKINEIEFDTIISNQKINYFNNHFDKNKLAKIIFTSGSTGKPKGVMISHHNIISNTNSIIEYLNLTSNDIMCVVLPFFYCYGLSLLHEHLRIGGSMVLNNNFIFLGSVISDLKNYKCTGFAGVPSHFQILLKKSNTFKNTNFSDLRYVTQAGGKLHTIFIEEFIKAFPRLPFYVMYGQTEATARLSYLPPHMIKKKMSSIGKAIPQVKLKVINNKGDIASVNEEGELLAKGDNIMLGYYKDLISTKNTIKNGWLYTGDLAKIDEDGFIYIVGRKKEILKVGGKRISPKEIEEVIDSITEVVDCTVTGIYDEFLGEAILATVVLKDQLDPKLMKDKILLTCSKKLSSFKIPHKLIFKNAITMNASGKKINH